MYSSARTAAISSSSRLKGTTGRSKSLACEYDLEACERTPLLLSPIKVARETNSHSQHRIYIHTSAVIGILALVLFLLAGIIIAVYLLLLQVPKPWPVSHAFYLVERYTWWTQPAPLEELPLNKSEVRNIIVLHTESETCRTQNSCIQYVRDLQQESWSRYNSHIPYNFLIGGDGKTYEGRGWKTQHGFVAFPGKNDTIVVGLIGTFLSNPPDAIQYAELKALITESIRRFALSPTYRIYGVENVSGSNALYSEIQNWKHWRGFIQI